MKFKLDENLGERGKAILGSADFEVATVRDQGMTSAVDDEIYSVCRREGRILVTLDLDFANPFRFPPVGGPGIAVLRLPKDTGLRELLHLVQVLVDGLRSGEEIEGRLWIVESDRIRVHESGIE